MVTHSSILSWEIMDRGAWRAAIHGLQRAAAARASMRPRGQYPKHNGDFLANMIMIWPSPYSERPTATGDPNLQATDLYLQSDQQPH